MRCVSGMTSVRIVLLVLLLNIGFGCGRSTHLEAGEDQSSEVDTVVVEESLERIPIREVTVFKDGHAFVLHEGELKIGAEGKIHLDHLPTPVMGTFWPYAAGNGVRLQSVLAATRTVRFKHAALDIQDLVRTNMGAKVRIKQVNDSFTATIVSVPSRSRAITASGAAVDDHSAAEPGSIVMLETAEGIRVIPLSSIQEVTFLERPNVDIETQRQQNVLSLQLDWAKGDKRDSANVGMVYIQRGIRWIPNYQLELDAEGKARVKLQATLINEMVNLENVNVNLVIGVPHFAFKETIDPIALGQATAQLSSYFQEGSQTALAFSNAIQTQVARMGEYRNRPSPRETQPAMDLGPELTPGDKREDLFVFTVKGISLHKGQRMVVPVVEFELPYEDVYTVKLDMAPPPELTRQSNNKQQQEMARLLHAPKAVHQARLTNSSKYPLTTAPALILRDGQPLGQAMMTYTPVGARVDVEITSAVDITVSKNDVESDRKPNAANWGGDSFDRIDLTGEIVLHNYTAEPVKLEVVRYVLGNVNDVGADGSADRMNVREEGWHLTGGYPSWWHWYNWPRGWFHFNGIGRLKWTVQLESGRGIELPYKWHYFWRR